MVGEMRLFPRCVYIAPAFLIILIVLHMDPSTTMALVTFTMGALLAWLGCGRLPDFREESCESQRAGRQRVQVKDGTCIGPGEV